MMSIKQARSCLRLPAAPALPMLLYRALFQLQMLAPVNVEIQIHTYINTHAHARKHTYTHAHTHTNTNTQQHTHVCSHARAPTHLHTSARTCTYTDKHTSTHTLSLSHTHWHSYCCTQKKYEALWSSVSIWHADILHKCEMTWFAHILASCVWNESFMCVTWLVQMRDMTHASVTHYSYEGVMSCMSMMSGMSHVNQSY